MPWWLTRFQGVPTLSPETLGSPCAAATSGPNCDRKRGFMCGTGRKREGARLGPGTPWLRDLHEFITTINSYSQRVVYRRTRDNQTAEPTPGPKPLLLAPQLPSPSPPPIFISFYFLFSLKKKAKEQNKKFPAKNKRSSYSYI